MLKFLNENRLLRLVNLVFIAGILNLLSCSERSISEPEPSDSSRQEGSVADMFKKQGFEKHLVEVFNDTANINWIPTWSGQVIENKRDSLQFIYIPLIPELTNSITKNRLTNAKFSGYVKYIIVKVVPGKESIFYTGTYTSSNTFSENSQILPNFTGTVRLKNLHSGIESLQHYSKGVEQNVSGQSNATGKTMSCVTYVTCSWGNWDCGAVNITSTTSIGMCDYPAYIPCFGGTWEVNHSESSTICTPDEPDPNNPGIPVLQPTTTPQMVNDHFKINLPTSYSAGINNYLDCITTRWSTGRNPRDPYTITVMIDQPINNSIFPLALVDPAVGHAYLQFEQKGQRAVENRASVGFWPNSLALPGQSVAGGIYSEQNFNGSLDVAVTFTVTWEEMETVANYVKTYGNAPYDILNRNCANMCSDALAQIGINIPNTWQQTFWYSSSSTGSPNSNNVYGPSIGAYGQVLKSFTHPKLLSKNISNVTTQPNMKTCP